MEELTPEQQILVAQAMERHKKTGADMFPQDTLRGRIKGKLFDMLPNPGNKWGTPGEARNAAFDAKYGKKGSNYRAGSPVKEEEIYQIGLQGGRIRDFIKDIITKQEAEKLNPGKQDFNNPIIKDILVKLGKSNPSLPSYAVVEQDTNGHDWHTDIGTNGHMKWCNTGVSILLKRSKEGLFKYKNPDKEYTQDEHYLNALVHSNNEWHMVEKSTKGRTVLLMFLT